VLFFSALFLGYTVCRSFNNGETLIVVHRVSRDTAADVARVLQFFGPLRVDIVPQSATSKYAGAGPMP
jgi:hypothetical protein